MVRQSPVAIQSTGCSSKDEIVEKAVEVGITAQGAFGVLSISVFNLR